ncbi:Uncharacterised protein [Bordetella pertussis]|nr:Uncharacterised protein [Bordetella pertussis]
MSANTRAASPGSSHRLRGLPRSGRNRLDAQPSHSASAAPSASWPIEADWLSISHSASMASGSKAR